MVGIRSSMLKAANVVLAPLDLQLARRTGDFANYIPLRQTLAEAEKLGLSVGDYIDGRYNVPGSTQQTIDRMIDLGVFDRRIEHVCEIGPGSGRYLEKTIRLCNPLTYEVYETAAEWRDWLVKKYGVTAQPTDGRTLSHTPSSSIDLVHAHKVLNGLPIFVACRYLAEMIRVVRSGGVIVFDIITEECMNDVVLEKWLAGGSDYICSMMPKRYALDYFHRRELQFLGSFLIASLPGMTEYLVFSK